MPWALVIAGCLGMFAATATGSSRSPFLPDIAHELSVSLPSVANLFAVTALCWGLASYLTGFVRTDRQRRALLLLAPAGLALFMIAVAWSPNYPILVFFIALAGLCCGSFTTAVLTEVSIQCHGDYHGRAFGYVMSGQSLTLLLGVPSAALLGAIIGWRGMHMVLAALALIALVYMIWVLHRSSDRQSESSVKNASKPKLRDVLQPTVIRLFLALIAERITFGLPAFYYASYLRVAHGLPIEQVAAPLMGFATGNIVGTLVGGQIADRFAYRRVSFAISLTLAGLISIPWFVWRPTLLATVGFGVCFAFFNASARPPLLAALAESPEHIRGMIMGLNSAFASIGWMCAAIIGGWLYASTGFDSFGIVIASMCLLAALVVIPDSRVRKSVQFDDSK